MMQGRVAWGGFCAAAPAAAGHGAHSSLRHNDRLRRHGLH